MAGNELLKIANVEKADWDLFVGDIGGVLLEKGKPTKAEAARITAVRTLWTGIKPEHHALVAKKAFEAERERQKKKKEQNKEMSFTPGVIALAIGEKSSAILQAIELG